MGSVTVETQSANPATIHPSELVDVSPHMSRIVTASRLIFETAITEATGQSAVERRAAIDRVVDQFRKRHYQLVMVDDRRAVSVC